MNSTLKAAEHMLQTGRAYTAETLGKEMGVSAKVATGYLYNIRTTSKYKVIETTNPRTIKLLSISGRTMTLNQMRRLAIFGRLHNGTKP